MRKNLARVLALVVVVASLGCEGDHERLADLAESSNQQQAEQNIAVAENTRAIAEGSKSLVSADAEARRELIDFQRDLRSDQAGLDRQREELDDDRYELVVQREARWRAGLLGRLTFSIATGQCVPRTKLVHQRSSTVSPRWRTVAGTQSLSANGVDRSPPRSAARVAVDPLRYL
jgi:hypothetical protein